MKIPVIEKNAQEDAIWQYFKSSNTFYESRDVVAPLRKHRLCDNQKTAYWDSFESRSRIFILTKFVWFWRNSEICPIFQWPITFSPFGICLNDFFVRILKFSNFQNCMVCISVLNIKGAIKVCLGQKDTWTACRWYYKAYAKCWW